MLVAAFATGPVLYPTPTFVYYKLAAIARGLDTIEIPLDAHFELDEIAVEHAIIEQRPSIVFLALPNNPTGTLWRMDFACELAARHRDTVIVSDEAYLAYCGRTNLPNLSAHPNLVVMRTLSKVGMAGLRVGYTVASPAIAHLLEKVRPPYNLSALDQRAALFMLREARRVVRGPRRRGRRRARPPRRRPRRARRGLPVRRRTSCSSASATPAPSGRSWSTRACWSVCSTRARSPAACASRSARRPRTTCVLRDAFPSFPCRLQVILDT